MSFIVKVYSIADKYQVSGLQQPASIRLDGACDPTGNVDDFILAVRLIDELTSPGDSALWSVVLPKTKENIGYLMTCEDFKKLIFDVPHFNLGLLSMLDEVTTTDASDGYGGRRLG